MTYNTATSSDDITGIVFVNSDKVGFYNIKTNKKLYENGNYSRIWSIDDKYIHVSPKLPEEGVNVDNIDKKYLPSIASIDHEEIVYTADIYDAYFGASNTKNGTFYKVNSMNELYKVLGDNFKELNVKEDGDTILLRSKYSLEKEGLYVLKNSTINLYNSKGEIVNSYNTSGNVIDVLDGYYLTIENDALYIKDFKDYNKKIIDWNKNYTYFANCSGYYNENELYDENEKRTGYYFIISNDKETYSGIEIYFDPETKTIDNWDIDEINPR